MRTANGNTASFPFPGKMGRTFCATISSTLPWPRTGTGWPARYTGALLKPERDIGHRSFHNQRVSTLTDPALNASHGDVLGRYAQMRDTTRVHERALFTSPRIPSELELQARWFAGDFGK